MPDSDEQRNGERDDNEPARLQHQGWNETGGIDKCPWSGDLVRRHGYGGEKGALLAVDNHLPNAVDCGRGGFGFHGVCLDGFRAGPLRAFADEFVRGEACRHNEGIDNTGENRRQTHHDANQEQGGDDITPYHEGSGDQGGQTAAMEHSLKGRRALIGKVPDIRFVEKVPHNLCAHLTGNILCENPCSPSAHIRENTLQSNEENNEARQQQHEYPVILAYCRKRREEREYLANGKTILHRIAATDGKPKKRDDKHRRRLQSGDQNHQSMHQHRRRQQIRRQERSRPLQVIEKDIDKGQYVLIDHAMLPVGDLQ